MTITTISTTTVDSTPIDIDIGTDNDFNNQNLTPAQRIINFVRDIGDILKTLELPGFKKMLQITTQNAYQFQRTPIEEGGPSLADCINTLIRDYNSIKDNHPEVGYYYNAMSLEFLQRSMRAVGADPEHIDALDNKIADEFNKFKG